ncbi:hypothetical protein BDY17DRAFT_326760 [Neohortaea acidophila]|uniref:2EXR domain-containing protein n=1 Tax=Neohortaea acidophila TaxID=245834 RepID=A0A6A6PNP9_9PEZI|nr:uncharacterized protein BDY17DRAFT_326760 [Neohortaea acidophila]KAF2480887.1 hypothetical protein BDY17DRAFT_326760 [Neohortaea acidophila]
MDSSPFGRLSPELRNMIWKLAVTQGGPTYIGFREKPEPPITRVCKQIRQESILVFYSEATFAVCVDLRSNQSKERLTQWYKSIGAEVCALVKLLTVYSTNIDKLDFSERYLSGLGPAGELEGRLLFHTHGQDSVSFRGPQVIRITERKADGTMVPRHDSLTSEWVRVSDGLYRRVEDQDSTWVQARIKELEIADKRIRFLSDAFGWLHDGAGLSYLYNDASDEYEDDYEDGDESE